MRKIHFVGLVLLAAVVMCMPARSSAQISVGIAVHIGPPALPVYVQPVCPGAGYIWTPGYWAYGEDDYYWVPGTWVIAPTVGYLWTPGYWGWGGGGYFWHAGYWGPHVGFYGGINYGFGYGGVGFVGGRWNGGVFAYNTAVTNVNTTVIHNTYINKTVVNNTTVNNVSYNGGTGGVKAQPTAAERAVESEHHIAPTTLQTQHEHAASTNHTLLASVNHGKPGIAATTKPGEFTGRGVVAAKAATLSSSSHTVSPNGGNRPPSNSANVSKTNRPPSYSRGAESNTSNVARTNALNTARTNSSNAARTNTSNTARLNNTASGAPKVQAHPQNKPQAESRPHAESRPPREGKPR
jgi:hypothetical protein